MLIVFLITLATCPLSTEFNSLTIITKQEQRTSRDKARSMRPMARSGRSVSAKRCRPGKKKRKTNRPRLIFVSDPKASSGFHAQPMKMGPEHTWQKLKMLSPFAAQNLFLRGALT